MAAGALLYHPSACRHLAWTASAIGRAYAFRGAGVGLQGDVVPSLVRPDGDAGGVVLFVPSARG